MLVRLFHTCTPEVFSTWLGFDKKSHLRNPFVSANFLIDLDCCTWISLSNQKLVTIEYCDNKLESCPDRETNVDKLVSLVACR